MTLLSLFAAPPTFTPPTLAPVLSSPTDTFKPAAMVEEGGDRLHIQPDPTTRATDMEWKSGRRPIDKILSTEGDDTYICGRANWNERPFATLRLDGMKRPHLGGGSFRLRIRHRVVDGTFYDMPRIGLMDHATRGKDWPGRVDGESRFDRLVGGTTVYPTAAWSWQEIDLDHDLVHGWQSNEGIKNFGDIGIRIAFPAGGSTDRTEWQVSEVQLLMNPIHPGEGEAAHWGVRPPSRSAPGQGWAVVDYDGTPLASQTVQVGREFYTAVEDGSPTAGLTLSNNGGGSGAAARRHVVADAIARSYYDVTSPGGSGFRIVEIEPMIPFHQAGGEQIFDWNIQGTNANNGAGRINAHWRQFSSYNATTGVVTGAGEFVRVDKLVVRSAAREATSATYPNYLDERAHISCPKSGDSMQITTFSNSAGVDVGHIAYVGLRFWRPTSGQIPVQTTFDRGSDNAIYGFYDCAWCGENTSQGHEMKTAIRGGQHAVDLMDSVMSTGWEHFLYHGGSRTQPTQMLRCFNQTGTQFYPSHPSPDLTFAPNGRMGNTLHQLVSRTNPLDASGEGNESGGDVLSEDSFQVNCTGDPSAFTISGSLGPYINRRCATFNPNTNGNGAVLLWIDAANGGQSGQPKGHHVSIGQFDGPENQFNNPPPPITPEQYPECGSMYAQGDAVMEDWALGSPTAGSNSNTIPFRTGGCKSFRVIRGNFGGYRTPAFADMPHGPTNVWSNSGAGPYSSLAYTLEGFGATPSTYTGWANNSPGAAKMRFGNPANTINPARLASPGAGVTASFANLADKASDYASVVAQNFYLGVDELGAPSTAWPPWPQVNANNLTAFPCGRVYPGMRKPVINLPNQPIAGQPSGSTIPWPGINNFIPLATQFVIDSPTVGGGTSGIVHGEVTMTCSSSMVVNGYGEGVGKSTATLACSSSMTVSSTTTNVATSSATLACTSSLTAIGYDSTSGTGGRESLFAPGAARATVSRSAAGRFVQARSGAGKLSYA